MRRGISQRGKHHIFYKPVRVNEFKYPLLKHSILSIPYLKAKQSVLFCRTGNNNDPNRQNCRKSSVEGCIFDYTALHIECRLKKTYSFRVIDGWQGSFIKKLS